VLCLGAGRSMPIPLFMLLNSALHPAGDEVEAADESVADCSATVLGGVAVPVMIAATTADLFCMPELKLVEGRCRDMDRLTIELSLAALSPLDPPKKPGRRRIDVFRFGLTGAVSTDSAGQSGLLGGITGDLALLAESSSFLVPRGWMVSSPYPA